MSDRIAVMNCGLIEQVADPEQVYAKPATAFVAGFIGVSNLMPGEVDGAGADGRVRLDTGVQIDADVHGLATGDRCHAVVRPEKLRISRLEDGPPDRHLSVEGIVESSVYLGTATQVVVIIEGDVHLTVLVPNADEAQRQALPGGGARVRLTWAPEHIHVVPESGVARPAEAQLRPGTELAASAASSSRSSNEEEHP